MRCQITLVTLNGNQIEMAKVANGERKRITHAVVCGPHGQMFGTLSHCRKYFDTWKEIFPRIFSHSAETTTFEINDYRSTPELVLRLIDLDDERKRASAETDSVSSMISAPMAKPQNWLTRIFGK